MKIIPAIDIIDGKCVRLTKGDYGTKKIYNESPLEVAKSFEDHGITHLHLVDLDGAKASKIVNHQVLENIASKTHLHIDFGGGLKKDDDVRIAFESGANQITGGSIAVKDRETFTNWINEFGGEKIILGADMNEGLIAVSGWQESSGIEWKSFMESYIDAGIQYVISTDISKDGMLEGAATELYKEMKELFPSLNVIASGGVADMSDLEKLAAVNCFGAIVGKAIYEGRISLKEIETWNNQYA